jgi:ribulose-5-phosphate 4-epimerase/fuculose-1-phosphate aldolase
MDLASTKTKQVRAAVSEAEWETRVDLAAAYRLVAMFGWDDLVFTHLSAKVPGTEHFLINPYGLMFDEITASSLVKVDVDGNKVMESEYDINPPGFNIHGCIHEARPDVGCIVHIHSVNGIAVSAQKHGLLPLSQQAHFILPGLGYHRYEGVALSRDERSRLVADLGQGTHLMLHNHGLLTVGPSVATAFVSMYLFEVACMIQVRALAGNPELISISPEILQHAAEQRREATRGKGSAIAWPGLLRRLDRHNPGYDA